MSWITNLRRKSKRIRNPSNLISRKNPCLYLIFFILICASCSIASAENLITLKDGSEIKGDVVSLQNNIYTVQTSFGPVQIPDSQIQNIAAENNFTAPLVNNTPVVGSHNPGIPNANNSSIPGFNNSSMPQFNGIQIPRTAGQLGPEAGAIQQKIFSNPQMMADIQSLMQDPEIMKLLSDPSFVAEVTNGDQSKMINNSKVQQLMQNPKIQSIMNTLMIQMGQEQSRQKNP